MRLMVIVSIQNRNWEMASLANLESLDPDAFLKSSAAQLAVGLDVGNASTCVTFVECND